MGSHLHDLAKAEIQDLQTAGINPTLEEIIWINDLCRQVDDPPGGTTVPAGCPVRAGNIWLWPWTVAGYEWYGRAVEWFSDRMETYCLGYALAQGPVEWAFDGLNDRHSAKRIVTEWAGHLHCSLPELTTAIAKVCGELPDFIDVHCEECAVGVVVRITDGEVGPCPRCGKPIAPKTGGRWSELIASLVAMTGTEPEVWLRKVSRDYLLEQVHAIIEQYKAKGDPPDGRDPAIVAQRNLGIAIMEIKRAHRGE